MKKYVDNFMQYRFLLSELVKKGIKLKYRRSYLGMIWSMLEPLLTMIVLTIVFGTLYGNTDRTFPVYILFTVHQGRFEIYTSELGNDQKGICTQIFVSAVQCAF
jgi:ABC-type polysaccharide/polyol phosphate export permease